MTLEIIISFQTALDEAHELVALAEGNEFCTRALLDLFHEKGGAFLTWHSTFGRAPCHLEAVLCDEARALLQAWRTA